MTVIPCDTRKFTWASPHGRGSFAPEGPVRWSSPDWRTAAEHWRNAPHQHSARLVLGLAGDLAPATPEEVLQAAALHQAAHFGAVAQPAMAQCGAYLPDHSGLTSGAGLQLVVFAPAGCRPPDWHSYTVKLAESLARQFRQPQVVVELQHNGVRRNVVGVTE